MSQISDVRSVEITRIAEYFDKIQNNRFSENRQHFENLFRRFDYNYSHHQEMNDDDITYVQLYIEVIR